MLPAGGFLRLRRTVRFGALIAACAALAGTPGGADPRIAVVHETRVALELRFDLLGVPGAKPVVETLAGSPGQTLSLSRVLPLKGGPLRVFVAVTPTPQAARETCRVRIVADARWVGRNAVVDRTIEIHPERLSVVELWSAPNGPARLVMGVSGTWAEKPRVVNVVPGHEPVEFLVEGQLTVDGTRTNFEQRHLTGLVGSPVRYSFRSVAGGTDDDPGGEVMIELTPVALANGELELNARAALEPDAPPGAGGKPPRRETLTRDRLLPGASLDVVVPLAEPGHALVFRVTAYF